MLTKSRTNPFVGSKRRRDLAGLTEHSTRHGCIQDRMEADQFLRG